MTDGRTFFFREHDCPNCGGKVVCVGDEQTCSVCLRDCSRDDDVPVHEPQMPSEGN